MAAQKAFLKVRRFVELDVLIAGVERYVRNKPDWQEWVHPATWLNQGRWLDEYENERRKPENDWWEECKQLHGGTCGGQYRHHVQKQLDAARAERIK